MQETFPVIFTPSYEKEEEVINENLILEGNTIYEIDPDCMRMKMQPQQEGESQELEQRATGGQNMKNLDAEAPAAAAEAPVPFSER